MPTENITLLTIIRDDSAWKARINAFAALPLYMQGLVLTSGRTIALGAEKLLAS